MIKRSVKLYKHSTSVTLEHEFWNILHKIKEKEGVPLSQLIEKIDKWRMEKEPVPNLSSGIRLYILSTLLPDINDFSS